MVSETFDASRWDEVDGFAFKDITFHRGRDTGVVRIAFNFKHRIGIDQSATCPSIPKFSPPFLAVAAARITEARATFNETERTLARNRQLSERGMVADQALDGALGAWLAPLRGLVDQSRAELAGLDERGRWNRMVEINVAAQVRALAGFPVIRAAWDAGRELSIQGWVFDVEAGRLNHLNVVDAAAAE